MSDSMIHYHGSPVSGHADQAARFYAGRHVMTSFAEPVHLPMIADVAASFVLDNGAFSAWRSGKPLDVDRYLDFVAEWHRHPGFEWAVIPDVIDGDEAANDAMLSRWPSFYAGVPVWHFHESLNRLRWLAGAYPRVALGSSGQWPTPGTDSWWERAGEAMGAIVDAHGRPMVKLHGLRMLAPKIFTRLPLASADSTNAAVNAGSVGRFGQYPPKYAYQRANVIADRIEAYQSAAAWAPSEVQADMWEAMAPGRESGETPNG